MNLPLGTPTSVGSRPRFRTLPAEAGVPVHGSNSRPIAEVEALRAPKAALKPPHSKTLRDHRMPPKSAARLEMLRL